MAKLRSEVKEGFRSMQTEITMNNHANNAKIGKVTDELKAVQERIDFNTKYTTTTINKQTGINHDINRKIDEIKEADENTYKEYDANFKSIHDILDKKSKESNVDLKPLEHKITILENLNASNNSFIDKQAKHLISHDNKFVELLDSIHDVNKMVGTHILNDIQTSDKFKLIDEKLHVLVNGSVNTEKKLTELIGKHNDLSTGLGSADVRIEEVVIKHNVLLDSVLFYDTKVTATTSLLGHLFMMICHYANIETDPETKSIIDALIQSTDGTPPHILTMKEIGVLVSTLPKKPIETTTTTTTTSTPPPIETTNEPNQLSKREAVLQRKFELAALREARLNRLKEEATNLKEQANIVMEGTNETNTTTTTTNTNGTTYTNAINLVKKDGNWGLTDNNNIYNIKKGGILPYVGIDKYKQCPNKKSKTQWTCAQGDCCLGTRKNNARYRFACWLFCHVNSSSDKRDRNNHANMLAAAHEIVQAENANPTNPSTPTISTFVDRSNGSKSELKKQFFSGDFDGIASYYGKAKKDCGVAISD